MKKYRTEKEWESLFREQTASNLSAAAFCKQKGIHPNVFYQKRKVLRNHNQDEKSFVRLDVHKPANCNLSQVNTLVKIGPIEIRPGQNTDQKQLFRIFTSALEAVNAQF
jgi:hypothetical protein